MGSTSSKSKRAEVDRTFAGIEVTRPGGSATSGPSELAGKNLEAGSTFGRYVVLSRVGTGGMGVVLAAYDPELDRRVALKLLKPSRRDAGIAQLRLQREARALAKLAHPNVVAVHDVGTHDGVLFLAMEFIEGTTLSEWADEASRSWREVLDVFAQVGRGLMAAHEVGLVHRDVKPENLMLDGQGGVRVTDFGLARGGDPDLSGRFSIEPVDWAEGESLSDMLGPSLTRTGALLGTPAYMAPEQFGRGEIDERADQFGYCASLYEILYGEHPFPGKTAAELSCQVEEGEIRPAPADSNVPLWVRRVVVRGLAADPDDRWPSMAALLEALASNPVAKRRAWLARAMLGTALIGGTYLAVVMTGADEGECEGMDRRLDGVWDDARRARVRSALVGTGLGHAEDTADRVVVGLDAFSQAWTEERRAACVATRVRGEQSEILLDRRMACFDRRLKDLRALVNALAEADGAVLQRAVSAVSGLPGLESCSSADELLDQEGPGPSAADEVDAIEDGLAEAGATVRTGRFARGLELAEAVVTRARAVEYPPVLGQALVVRADLRSKTGDYEGAEKDATAAYQIALRLGRTRDAARAANSLVYTVGYQQQRHEAARVWCLQAETLAESLGDPEILGRTLNAVALVAMSEGDYARARELHRRVIASMTGAASLSMATSYNNLGVAAFRDGDFEAARENYEKALAIREKALGENHPLVAETMNNLGGLAAEQEDFPRARAFLERALEVRERALGPNHPDVAAAHDNVGAIALEQGELDVAQMHAARALELFERALGPDHRSLAFTHRNIADVAAARGDHARALEHFRRAVQISEETIGPEHPDTVGASRKLAAALFALARELWDAPAPERDRERSLELAGEARERFAAAKAAEGELEVRAWLEQHALR